MLLLVGCHHEQLGQDLDNHPFKEWPIGLANRIAALASRLLFVHDADERRVVPFLRVVEEVVREKAVDANDQLEVI